MYFEHFGFKFQPFGFNSDTSLMWFSENHTRGMDEIQLSVQTRKGAILLTGATGIGKTTIVRTLLKYFQQNMQTSLITDSRIQSKNSGVLKIVCNDFGMDTGSDNPNEQVLFNRLYEFLLQNTFQGKEYLVILDDVQFVNEKILQQIQLLTDAETNTRKLLQVILIAQPEILQLLKLPQYLKLRRRIQLHIQIQAFNLKETREYIYHQLKAAGYEGKPIFTNDAIDKIFLFTNGVPKAINKLCHESLLSAYSKNKKKIGSQIIIDAWDGFLEGEKKQNGNHNGFVSGKEFAAIIKHFDGWYVGEDFSAILKRERLRSDRTGIPLSYLLIEIPKNSTKVRTVPESRFYEFLKKLIILISENTRNLDIKYIFDSFKIGILLIDTPMEGAKILIEKISGMLIGKLEAENEAENIIFIESISISSYPINQVYDFNRIEGVPVVLKNLNFSGTPEEGNTKAKKMSFTEHFKVFFNWKAVPNADGSLALAAPLLGDLFDKTHQDYLFEKFKRLIDIFGSLIGIIFFSPLMLMIALFIKLSSKGPVLFKQKRSGHLGRLFTFLKFRTMRIDGDDNIHRDYVRKLIEGEHETINNGGDGEPLYKITDDPRITRIGRVLRKTSLDELPQLFNVLKGEMSLVGPRPPIPYEVDMYKSWHYRRVLEVKPGITGWWQVNGRSQTTFDDMVRMDLHYVNNQSVKLDTKIVLKTLGALINSRGAL